MIVITYHCIPNPCFILDESIAGSYVNCYINVDSLEEAIVIAKEKISEEKWDIIEFDSAYMARRIDYSENNENLDYYEQALIDDWVLVFHTYPWEEKEE